MHNVSHIHINRNVTHEFDFDIYCLINFQTLSLAIPEKINEKL